MNKNTLKSIIELQADRINQLEAVVKVRRKEMNVLESRLKAYQAESKSHKENAEKWNEEADRVNEILDKKDQEYHKLKKECNSYKEMVDEQNLQIALMNEDDGAKIKEIETKCAENIARAERHYENLMAVMILKETLRLFKQIENAIEPNPFESQNLGMEYYMESLYMGQHQRESIQIILSDMDIKGMKDEDIVQEAIARTQIRIKELGGETC